MIGGGGCFSCDRIFHRDDRKTLSDRVKVPRCFDFLKSGFRLCRYRLLLYDGFFSIFRGK